MIIPGSFYGLLKSQFFLLATAKQICIMCTFCELKSAEISLKFFVDSNWIQNDFKTERGKGQEIGWNPLLFNDRANLLENLLCACLCVSSSSLIGKESLTMLITSECAWVIFMHSCSWWTDSRVFEASSSTVSAAFLISSNHLFDSPLFLFIHLFLSRDEKSTGVSGRQTENGYSKSSTTPKKNILHISDGK